MGHNFGIFEATYESRGQIADSPYWVKGSHLAKFGADYNHVNEHIIWPGFSPMRVGLLWQRAGNRIAAGESELTIRTYNV